jgi:hypothetical protein
MIGVIITNKEYLPLAQLAADRFNHFTGLPYILIKLNGKAPHIDKLRVHDYIPDTKTCVVIDSDLHFVRRCNLLEFKDRKEFIAVKDVIEHNTEECLFVKDCRLHGINRSLFFNSGFFIWNHRHKGILKDAENLSQTLKVSDWGEQTVLNLAVQRSGADIKLISSNYNSMKIFEDRKTKQSERDSFAIHAAGIAGASNKLAYLKQQAKKYKHYE